MCSSGENWLTKLWLSTQQNIMQALQMMCGLYAQEASRRTHEEPTVVASAEEELGWLANYEFFTSSPLLPVE